MSLEGLENIAEEVDAKSGEKKDRLPKKELKERANRQTECDGQESNT